MQENVRLAQLVRRISATIDEDAIAIASAPSAAEAGSRPSRRNRNASTDWLSPRATSSHTIRSLAQAQLVSPDVLHAEFEADLNMRRARRGSLDGKAREEAALASLKAMADLQSANKVEQERTERATRPRLSSVGEQAPAKTKNDSLLAALDAMDEEFKTAESVPEKAQPRTARRGTQSTTNNTTGPMPARTPRDTGSSNASGPATARTPREAGAKLTSGVVAAAIPPPAATADTPRAAPQKGTMLQRLGAKTSPRPPVTTSAAPDDATPRSGGVRQRLARLGRSPLA